MAQASDAGARNWTGGVESNRPCGCAGALCTGQCRRPRLENDMNVELDPATPYPRRSKAIIVIVILMIVTFHARLDQQFPAMLVKPIRDAFQISDTQVSLFQGASFAVLYAIAGPLFGRLVDHRNRRNLIIGGVLFWSVMTVWSGYTTSYMQLV